MLIYVDILEGSSTICVLWY